MKSFFNVRAVVATVATVASVVAYGMGCDLNEVGISGAYNLGTSYSGSIQRGNVSISWCEDPSDDPLFTDYPGLYHSSVWFKWTASDEDGILHLDTKDSTFDTVIYAIVAIPENATTPETLSSARILNDDDAYTHETWSSVDMHVLSGRTVYIAVASKAGGDTGSFKLNYKFHPLDGFLLFDSQGGSTPAPRGLYVTTDGSYTIGQCADIQGVPAYPLSARPGYEFDGWWTQIDGGEEYNEEVYATEGTVFYAHWKASAGGVPAGAAGRFLTSYDKSQEVFGKFVSVADGKILGTAQIRLSKPNSKKKAKISGRVTLLNLKRAVLKCNFKFNDDYSTDATPIDIKMPDGTTDTLYMTIASDGTFTIKGSVYKILAAKVGNTIDAKEMTFQAPALKTNLPAVDRFYDLLKDALPLSMKFEVVNGRKWKFPKGTAIRIRKVRLGGTMVPVLWGNDALNPNKSQIKLSYTYRTGIFKGPFNVYAISSYSRRPTATPSLKLKTYKVKVSGFIIDDIGYGEAVTDSPKDQTWPVTIVK